jgi:predicted HAD superfamily Cof-like phosphohydrolase
LDSKLTALYPSAKHDARSVANALIQFFATYGVFDTIVTDPGSEFANALVAHLTKSFADSEPGSVTIVSNTP